MTQKYIGGNFSSIDILPYSINPSNSQVLENFPEFLNASYRNYFETGTDALAEIMKEIKEYYPNKNLIIWFPEHYCEEAIDRLKLKIESESIEKYKKIKDLRISEKHIHIVILLHFNRYLIPLSEVCMDLKRYHNVITIEDFVQCPFEIKLFNGDYAFNSLRKFLNADISIAYLRKTYSVTNSQSKYHILKQKAATIKAEFAITNEPILEENYLHIFKEAEEALLEDQAICLALSDEINKLNYIDFKSIIRRRKENFIALKKLLNACDQVQILEGDYFFLMLKCEKRDALKNFLFNENIFVPIHWIDTTSVLSKQLLSIPIDQRYNTPDLKRIFEVINQFYTT